MNSRFFTFHTKQRPYIILKWAQSFDHKISADNATRVSISGDVANRLVHKWRSEEAAILVGTNTVLADDPQLTTRLWNGNNPTRLVLDPHLRLPSNLKIFDGVVKTILLNYSVDKEQANLKYVKIEKESFLPSLMHVLHKENIQSVLVEGGAKLLNTFIDGHLWDEARVITNTKLLLQHGTEAPLLVNATLEKQEQYENDMINYFRPCVL